MKKITNIFVCLTLIVTFIPLVVKADASPRKWYTELEKSEVVSGDELNYTVKYEVTSSDTKEDMVSKGETKTVYVKFDSDILRFVSAKETTLTNSGVETTVIKNGVVKLTITSNNSYKEFNMSTQMTFKVQDLSEDKKTTIELIPSYEYEPNTDVSGDSDPFWLGEVESGNKTREISISKKKVESTDTDKNNDAVKEDKTVDSNQKYKKIIYALVVSNVILLIATVTLLSRPKAKQGE